MKAFRITISLTAIALLVFSLARQVSAEEISVVGTGSGAKIIEMLGDSFTKSNPDCKVLVPPSIGSGGGIKAVGTDQALIARIARELKESEKEYGITYTPILKLPIVFFVNKSVGIQNLSPQQACDIYSGKITNWKDVGGPDADIRVIRREDGDSSLEVLQKKLPGFKDITLTQKSKTTLSDPETCEMVQAKENTIAFGTYANTKGMDLTVLKIDGKDPSDVSSYPYFGILALIYKEKNKTGNVGKLIDFATSPEAKDVILNAGGFPL